MQKVGRLMGTVAMEVGGRPACLVHVGSPVWYQPQLNEPVLSCVRCIYLPDGWAST